MPPFPKPAFTYNYQLDAQIEALRTYRDTKVGRSIPTKRDGHLVLATWNIANLGVQERREKDYRLLAELISWFDLVAVQEVNDNLAGLRALHQQLPASYRVLFSDHAGNKERLAFFFDGDRVTQLEKVGEIAIEPSALRYIKLPGVEQKFKGFDRTPYLGSFRCGSLTFLLANVHLYFGSDSTLSKNRRSLEAYAVGRWADLRRKSPYAFTKDIIALGDFNLPKVDPGDPIYAALTKRGLHVPEHSTEIGSSIATDNHYDQLAFFPGETEHEFLDSGVFDFDGAIFQHLWETRGESDFRAYLRYYISDHRLLWANFQT